MINNILKVFTNINDSNLAFHVTNDKKQVINSRKKLCEKYNLKYENLKYMKQTHSNVVEIINKNDKIYNSDAIVTNILQYPLLVMVADCIPILFYDEVKKVIAVAHAGRNGTYLDISSNVIDTMINDFACNTKNIKILLGPSIQNCCYEVSDELALIASKNFGNDVVCNRNVNLQKINFKQLINKGILENNIEISSVCTRCNGKNYYSYRNNKNCGRFAGVICLQ